MMSDQKTNDDRTTSGEQPQDTLPQFMAAAMLSVLDHYQTLAVRAMLGAPELRDFLRGLSAFAKTVEERADKLRGANGHDKPPEPEPEQKPDAADDAALSNWLEKEKAGGPTH